MNNRAGVVPLLPKLIKPTEGKQNRGMRPYGTSEQLKKQWKEALKRLKHGSSVEDQRHLPLP